MSIPLLQVLIEFPLEIRWNQKGVDKIENRGVDKIAQLIELPYNCLVITHVVIQADWQSIDRFYIGTKMCWVKLKVRSS